MLYGLLTVIRVSSTMDSSGRPENLLFTHILVPPVCIRPSVHMDGGGSNEDDLTVKLQSIIEHNMALKRAMSVGQQRVDEVYELWYVAERERHTHRET